METLISKPTRSFRIRKPETSKHLIFLSFVFFFLSFIFSGSKPLPQESSLKNDDIRNKRLDILQKLESGKAISSEDIRSSYSNLTVDNPEPGDPDSPEILQLPGLQSFPKMHSFPGPFFYQNHDGRVHVIISDNDIREIHKRLNDSMEELKKNIESFRNSDDFIIIHDELQKWNENFRKELDKMREELIKSEKETRSKGTISALI
jgi:hypothetical protein